MAENSELAVLTPQENINEKQEKKYADESLSTICFNVKGHVGA